MPTRSVVVESQGSDAERSELEPMSGWLRKRHAGKPLFGGQWSKRWVEINDERGRLHIGKKKGREGTTVFSLSEVSSMRSLEPTSKEADGHMFCFLVSQAPLQVTLRCRTSEESKLWMAQLSLRLEIWRERRAAEGVEVGISRPAIRSPGDARREAGTSSGAGPSAVQVDLAALNAPPRAYQVVIPADKGSPSTTHSLESSPSMAALVTRGSMRPRRSHEDDESSADEDDDAADAVHEIN